MKTLLRSFFIQCSWNLERMQNLGFLYAIMPALKRVYPDSEDRKKAQLRHLDLFNSQPYMASPILGAVINLEKECVREGKGTETISTFKPVSVDKFNFNPSNDCKSFISNSISNF